MKVQLLYILQNHSHSYILPCGYLFFSGSEDAPSSHYIITVGFPVAELVVIGVLVGLGLMIAVAFLIFNIVWRQNKSEPCPSVMHAELEIHNHNIN